MASPSTGAMGEKQREYLSDIRTSGQTLLAIIDDILDISKIQSGKYTLNSREIDLEEIDTTAFKERYGGNMKNIDTTKLKVQAALADLIALVDRHLDDEERDVVPLIEEYVTSAEWAKAIAMMRHGFGGHPFGPKPELQEDRQISRVGDIWKPE